MQRLQVSGKDDKVRQSLWNNCRQFADALGAPLRSDLSLRFPIDRCPFDGFQVRYMEDKKFLGKIYAMVIEARVERGCRTYHDQRVELSYSGFVRKGTPFFRPMKGKRKGQEDSAPLAKALNGDKRLLQACFSLDLEFLRVLYDRQEETWKIQARPYGGSLVRLMLPPLQYNVMLPEGHAGGILSMMKEIAGILHDGERGRGTARCSS